MWLGFLPMWSNYTWFLYLGIIFVLLHAFLYGFGINQSYFGILLLLIWWMKPVLSGWFINFLWILIVLDIVANIRKMASLLKPKYVVFDDSSKKKKKESLKGKKESMKSK